MKEWNDNKAKSKRIARNSGLLFVRMFVIMVVNLYVVRLLLVGLGEADYGVYNAVAGLVAMFGSLNTVLSVSVQRYYSTALGEGNPNGMSEIFSSAININMAFVGIVILVAETVGLWFIHSHMVFPPGRLSAAVGCFQFSLVSFLCTLAQVPFLAAIVAKEDMGVFAWISSTECLLRLVAAALLPFVSVDSLVFYSGALALTSVVVLSAYVLICRQRYAECRYRSVRTSGLYGKLLSFSGWTMYGSVSGVCLLQGNTLLLNVFFGYLVNAAFAIALQIYNAFMALCNAVFLAFRPPLVKSYAEGDYDNVNRLFYAGNKFILYALICVAVPLFSEMRTVLRLWLGDVSADVLLFSRLAIVYVVCMAMNNPVTAVIHATGQVKGYHSRVETVILLCLPLTWLLFKCGLPAQSVFYCMTGLCILAHIERLVCLRRYYAPFSMRVYFMDIVLRPVPIVLSLSLFAWIVRNLVHGGEVTGILCVFASSVPFCLYMVMSWGLNKRERAFVQGFAKSLIRKAAIW